MSRGTDRRCARDSRVDGCEVDYTADVQNNQGTMQIYGGWVTLYSASTGTSGLFNLFAASQAAFNASLKDAAQMMVSMD
jgi:hypothetical protein